MTNSLVVHIMLKEGSESPQNFSSIGVHRSRFEYGTLRLVLIISSSSELGIVY